MEDNYLPEKVQFILLDYNSSDGLDEWMKGLGNYLDSGILVYYKTPEPKTYHRSHSRNISFRLSDAEIVCNLDADNYLGKGFANYIIDSFESTPGQKKIITSDCSSRDSFGRICVYKEDFVNIKGYDESLVGYGMEDTELYYRFLKEGYEQEFLKDPAFYNVISHSHEERVSQEPRFKNRKTIYISHTSPYCISFLVLYNDKTCEYGSLIANRLFYFNVMNEYPNRIEMYLNEKNKIILQSHSEGEWEVMQTDNKNNRINIKINDTCDTIDEDLSIVEYDNIIFRKVTDTDFQAHIITEISDAINYNVVKKKICENKNITNPNGFGKGIVFRNFDYESPIVLK
jgi:Glycosyltransferases, probably involved in cell wall biogenesis